MNAPPCRVCGEAEGDIRSLRELMYATGRRFDYFRCRRCGCQQICQVPDDLGPFYPADYYSLRLSPGSRGIRARVMKWGASWAVGNRAPWGLPARLLLPNAELAGIWRLHLDRRSRVLDVGCGNGQLLCYLAAAGMTSVAGIDPFIAGDMEPCPGVRIRKGVLEDLPRRDEWDLIMFHHVFEHLPDPRRAMADVAARLTPGGRCLIRVPLVESWAGRHYGDRWIQLDPPRHLHLYTERSIQTLAASAGLAVVDAFLDSTSVQFWGSRRASQDQPIVGIPTGLRQRLRWVGWEFPARVLNWRGLGDQGGFVLARANA